MDLADKTAIERLIAQYARNVDLGRYADLGKMFTHGRITANRREEPLEGAQAVQAFYSGTNRIHDDGTAKTHHIVTNLEFGDTPRPDRIEVRACFVVFQATPKLPLQPIACGRYADVFQKLDGDWRYLSKHIEVTLVGDTHEHLSIRI